MVRRKTNTAIGKCADHQATLEFAVHGLLDHLHHGGIHPLQDRCQIDMCAVWIGLCLIRVNANDHQRIGAKFVGKRC